MARQQLLQIYQQALASVNGRPAVAGWLKSHDFPRCSIVAVGKAAEAMLQGAFDELGASVEAALLISKHGHITTPLWSSHPVQLVESAHPVPDESSLRAGQVSLDFIAAQPPGQPLLFLVSGGTSSLVEVLQDGVELSELQAINHELLGGGLDIEQMNRARKRLSRIKGGGLLGFLGNRPATVLLISDVPGDDLSVIGSGMLYATGETAIPHHIVANLDMALNAAAEAARALGHDVYLNQESMTGSVAEEGESFAHELFKGASGVYICGGETTMELPPNPGRGGRNQHLALILAREIDGHKGLSVLAAGTDGSDGATEDAGALVDDTTAQRARWEGLDVERTLTDADSGHFLSVVGDVLNTGSTGTNVMDLLIGIKY